MPRSFTDSDAQADHLRQVYGGPPKLRTKAEAALYFYFLLVTFNS